MKIKTVIIEDIKSYIETLKIMLSIYPQIEIVATASNKAEGVDVLKKHMPDLVFMDIQLGKNSGFEILEECSDYYKTVIFITSHEEYAIKGYNYKVLHYLLKPFDEDALSIAINKTNRHFENQTNIIDIRNSVFKINNLKSNKIFFPDRNVHHAIEVDSIIYIESDAAYSNIFTLTRTIKVSKNLSMMTQVLNNYTEFIRIHRSFLVNKNHIINLKRGNESSVYLTNGYVLPISNNEKATLFTQLGIRE